MNRPRELNLPRVKRREFLVGSVTVAGSVGLSVIAPAANENDSRGETEIIERVQRAMLSMQRASWEQGIAAQALFELGDHESVYLMAKELVLRQAADGRLGVVYTDHGATDGLMGGEALIVAARRSGDPELQAGIDRQLDFLIAKCPRAADGTLYHRLYEPEIWIDSLNTAAPFFAALGRHDDALRQIRGHRLRLWNEKDSLFSHMWDEKRGVFKRAAYWGVGNGWAAYAVARVVRMLPKSRAAEKDELIGYVKAVLKGCRTHVRPDGLFHDVVNQPDTFVETNLSQMLAATIYRGVSDGWLDDDYLAQADTMRRAAYGKVDEFGYVLGVCGAPFFDKPGRATEGQAFFLLMEAAHRDLTAK